MSIEAMKHCAVCQGRGEVDTGINESPVTVCNACNGTGIRQAIEQAQKQEPVAHCTVRPLRGDESYPKTEIIWVKGQPVAGPLYTSPPPSPVAEPHKPLPTEPTKEMIDAAERIDWADADVRGNIVNMWQAMAAVAPQRQPLTDDELSLIYEKHHDQYGGAIDSSENGWAYEREIIRAAHGITGEHK